ncbi:Transposon Ty3-I Gag-Pol polyprotein [Vespula squamosa]|uniref:Transposon Ty3-I Gag-Pol polyprotein n=1 Tax=Vespula squamosa TaxID=30214 RepID=A0ABD1ZS76_VESSQ
MTSGLHFQEHRPGEKLPKVQVILGGMTIRNCINIGGFGGTRSTKKYTNLLMEHFTRYAWISTSKTRNANDFKKLVRKVTKSGKIGMVLTDQYPGINSREFEELLKEEKIL